MEEGEWECRRNEWFSLNSDLVLVGAQTPEDADVLPVRRGFGGRGISIHSPISLTVDSQPLLEFVHWTTARPSDRILLRAHAGLLPCLCLEQLGLNKGEFVVKAQPYFKLTSV